MEITPELERIIAHVAEAKTHFLLAAHCLDIEMRKHEIVMLEKSIEATRPLIEAYGGEEKLPRPVLLEWLVATKALAKLQSSQR